MMPVTEVKNLINHRTMRKALILVLATISFFSAEAQEAAPAQTPVWTDPMLPVYALGVFVFLVVILVGFVAIYLIKILNMLSVQAGKDHAQRAGIAFVAPMGWWRRFLQKVNASVPVEQEKTIELGHSYDGIRELDNHLPPWWTWLFIVTIVWAAVYMFVYHFSDTLPLQEQEYQHELAEAAEQARKLKASQPQEVVNEDALAFTNDPDMIEKGRVVFMNNNCGSCHRNDGGGNAIGPNLTDEYWLHGGDIKQIYRTVKNGAVEKGMPAWGKSMSPQNVVEVTFFILSLQGSHPVDARAPQGELFKPVPVASDSAAAVRAAL